LEPAKAGEDGVESGGDDQPGGIPVIEEAFPAANPSRRDGVDTSATAKWVCWKHAVSPDTAFDELDVEHGDDDKFACGLLGLLDFRDRGGGTGKVYWCSSPCSSTARAPMLTGSGPQPCSSSASISAPANSGWSTIVAMDGRRDDEAHAEAASSSSVSDDEKAITSGDLNEA
jgi:hypothetical protein